MLADPFDPGLLSRLPEPPRKVVVVRALRIGDFICATPALRALRAALPGAEISLIGLPFVRDLVDRSPALDRFIEFPGFPGMAEQFFDPRRALAFFQQMQAEQFDLAIQMNGSGVNSNPFTLLLGARVTAGYVRPGDPAGRLDAAFPMPAQSHAVQQALDLVTFLGAPVRGTETEFRLLGEDHAAAESMLAHAQRPLIGLHPAAREATKRWAPERFAEAGSQLQEQFGGTVVLMGGPAERELAEQVALNITGPHLNLAGQTSLTVLGAVIARLSVLITNDSGPAHISYALGPPTVTIFGGTDPARWGPPTAPLFRTVVNRISCWPCDYWECPVGYRCLDGITVDRVVREAEQIIRFSVKRNEVSETQTARGRDDK
jgi:ADP-heptose:LPS heptosyltransferase